MELIFQIGLVFLLVFLNGFFVASEFALVAVRKSRIDELVKRGNKTAKLVQKSIDHLDTYISATQLGITLASLALGWIGEPAIAHFLEPILNNYLPENLAFITSNAIAIAIAFSIITFLHIVLGELVPKTVALQSAEKTALLIIAPLTFFTKVFKPFIYVLNGAGILVLKAVNFKAPTGHQLVHSEEEIRIILAQSAEEGAIDKEEAEMVYSVLRFGDIPVRKVMVPRTKIIAFEKNSSMLKVLEKTQKYTHSRFPVYDGNIDNIIGFVHIKDIYINLVNHKASKLADIYKNFLKVNSNESINHIKIIRKIPHVKEEDRIDDVLILLRRNRVHIAVVDEEGGGTAGIVALEDIVENLVGEIKDEFDELEKSTSSK